MSWIVTLIVGGLVGGTVARLLPGGQPLLGAVLGVAGAALAGWLVGFLGLRITVRLDQLVAGVVGAALAVLAARAATRR